MLLAVVAALASSPDAPAQCAMANDLRLQTADGATIALHHHACAGGPPVLLVHGISSNARFFDLDAGHSMADWLADRGHDVWLLDLRGHGAAVRDLDGRRQVSGWTVDDYGRYDVAAAVDHIRGVTGYDTVGFVGHSMGGMVGAVYACSGGADKLSSLVALGSPAAFSREDPLMGLAQVAFAAGGSLTLWVESPIFADAAAGMGEWLPLVDRLYNPDNFEPATARAMLRSIVSPLSREEMRHFSRMLRHERFQSYDGSIVYEDALGDVRVPTLAVVGSGDGVVPERSVRAWGERVGGEVLVIEAGVASGMQADYGHLDLGLGERAADEVFPHVDAWLDAHAPVRTSAPRPLRP